jgi:glutamyl-tRNA synthetase
MNDHHSNTVRVRFAPSPTGYLHIGGARTVLFNWLHARKHGGTFVLRIEDTDQDRHVADSVRKILEDLRWLGLHWDEGPEVEGPYGPYFQSQRLKLYHEHLERLLEAGKAYFALETPEDLAAMRAKAKAAGRAFKYVRPDPLPTVAQGLDARAGGRSIVVRLQMPDAAITVHDRILGDVTVAAEQLEDFVIQKSDGFPTYHFACVVDDALMKISDVLRAQEHLMNTPKHIALQRALEFPTPRYAHLPLIFNIDGTKMSKRDKEKAVARGERPPEIDVHDFRASGYLPEAVLNYIALLGWSPGDDREKFELRELVEAFDLERIGKTNARFDRAKLLAFNTEWAARRSPERLTEAFRDYLIVNGSPLSRTDDATLRRWVEVCHGFRVFADVENKTKFLHVADDAVSYDSKAVEKVLAKNGQSGFAMLAFGLTRLARVEPWKAAAIEELLKAIAEERGVKLADIAQPIRVAVTGTTISPAIGESLELLGRERSVARIRRCLALREEGGRD